MQMPRAPRALLPEQVIQLKMWNPYSDWRGMAESKPLPAEADYLAGKFNLNLMRKNADEGAYIIAKDGLPQDGQRQQMIDQIRESGDQPVFFWTATSPSKIRRRAADAIFWRRACKAARDIYCPWACRLPWPMSR